jgi:hypothetical protein
MSAPQYDDYESPPKPRVTGSPERIWLVYGELEHDDTHEALIAADNHVGWCGQSVFDTDQEYVRADIHQGLCGALRDLLHDGWPLHFGRPVMMEPKSVTVARAALAKAEAALS